MRVTLTKEISQSQMDWRNDPKIMQWTRQSIPLGDYQMFKWKTKIEEDPSIEMFGLIAHPTPDAMNLKDLSHLATPQPMENIGTCGLTSINLMHSTAEFSLLINPRYWRQGWGLMSLIALFRFGFNTLGLNCIWGEAFEGNPALSLFKKIGMHVEGLHRSRYRKGGVYINAISISILRDEFIGRLKHAV